MERWPEREGLIVDGACRDALLPVGKLFRPMLLLASADAVGGDLLEFMPAAIGAEYGHAASLVHDDLIDGDEVRRGRESVWSKYGNVDAILTGDLLIFCLFECLTECIKLGVPAERVVAAVGSVARAGCDLCRGQSLELELSGSLTTEVDDYLRMVQLKTSALFRASCQTGAHLAGAKDADLDLLTSYADHLGIAFQVQDDLLSYTGGEGQMGKDRGSDIRNGRMVLPIIFAYQNESPSGRRDIEMCLSGQLDAAEALSIMTSMVIRSGALERTAGVAAEHALAASAAVSGLPPSRGRELLRGFVLQLAGSNDTSGRG
jgi:geranylgeranyl diphosphate synthase type I